MKKCRRCNKPATLHITEIKEGEIRALHLCEQCAQEYLTNVEAGDLSAGEAPEEKSGLDVEPSDDDDRACPKCGITFKKFRSQGRLGCAHDYVVFRERLVPLLESIHSETQHVGKAPQRRPDVSRRQSELARLRSSLRTAVEEEDYEAAAGLRDSIRKLEEGSAEE
jgi:protein arginine kinase activator